MKQCQQFVLSFQSNMKLIATPNDRFTCLVRQILGWQHSNTKFNFVILQARIKCLYSLLFLFLRESIFTSLFLKESLYSLFWSINTPSVLLIIDLLGKQLSKQTVTDSKIMRQIQLLIQSFLCNLHAVQFKSPTNKNLNYFIILLYQGQISFSCNESEIKLGHEKIVKYQIETSQ